ILMIRNYELVLFLVVAVCVEILGYVILSLTMPNQFYFNPIPLSYLLIPLGGLIFGFGTVFAGGCAGGTCYRIGNGSISALLAFLGFAFGIGLMNISPLSTIITSARNKTTLEVNGETPSLIQFLPMSVIISFSLLILIYSIYYYRNLIKSDKIKLDHLKKYWNPVTTGLILGTLGVLARYNSMLYDRFFGLSTTDGIAEIFLSLFQVSTMDWAGNFIVGLILGSLISSYLSKEFKINIPPRIEIMRFFGGGILMGIGAMLGLGCNFGHILGGIPELGLSSIISLIFMVIGNWLGSHIYYSAWNNSLPESTPI
ncbi:MAG: YeeE/YedE family protein, partial [Candidatus Heimdallarchaeota archaeon]|nr:YeeE/YedE family protein [Candidatus Heimdallarchaeota archaeon]